MMQDQKDYSEEEIQKLRELELQRKLLLRKLLSPEARERLANVKLANPELARKVEDLVIYLHQAGQLSGPLSEAQLKALLQKIVGRRREPRIIRK